MKPSTVTEIPRATRPVNRPDAEFVGMYAVKDGYAGAIITGPLYKDPATGKTLMVYSKGGGWKTM